MADSPTSFPGQDESLAIHRQPDELTVDEELLLSHFKLRLGDNWGKKGLASLVSQQD
jgi:hypothetical protein